MSNEIGTVIRVEQGRAWVLVKRSTMCDSCSSQGACQTLGGGKDMECQAFNDLGAVVGNTVEVEIKSKSLLKIAFLFYIFPICALIAGAAYGGKQAPHWEMDPDLLALIFGVAAFIFSFIIVHIIGRWLKNSRNHIPEIVKILGNDLKMGDTKE